MLEMASLKAVLNSMHTTNKRNITKYSLQQFSKQSWRVHTLAEVHVARKETV